MDEEHDLSLRHLPDVSHFSFHPNHEPTEIEESFQIPTTGQSSLMRDAGEYSYLLADVEDDFFANLSKGKGRQGEEEDSFAIPNTVEIGLRRSPRKRTGTGMVGSTPRADAKAKAKILGPANTPRMRGRSKSRSVSPAKKGKGKDLGQLVEDEELEDAGATSTPRRMVKLKNEIALLDEEFDFDMEGVSGTSEDLMPVFSAKEKRGRKSLFSRPPLGPFDFSALEVSESDIAPQITETQPPAQDESQRTTSASNTKTINKPTSTSFPVQDATISGASTTTTVPARTTRSRSKTVSLPEPKPMTTFAAEATSSQEQSSVEERLPHSEVLPSAVDNATITNIKQGSDSSKPKSTTEKATGHGRSKSMTISKPVSKPVPTSTSTQPVSASHELSVVGEKRLPPVATTTFAMTTTATATNTEASSNTSADANSDPAQLKPKTQKLTTGHGRSRSRTISRPASISTTFTATTSTKPMSSAATATLAASTHPPVLTSASASEPASMLESKPESESGAESASTSSSSWLNKHLSTVASFVKANSRKSKSIEESVAVTVGANGTADADVAKEEVRTNETERSSTAPTLSAPGPIYTSNSSSVPLKSETSEADAPTTSTSTSISTVAAFVKANKPKSKSGSSIFGTRANTAFASSSGLAEPSASAAPASTSTPASSAPIGVDSTIAIAAQTQVEVPTLDNAGPSTEGEGGEDVKRDEDSDSVDMALDDAELVQEAPVQIESDAYTDVEQAYVAAAHEDEACAEPEAEMQLEVADPILEHATHGEDQRSKQKQKSGTERQPPAMKTLATEKNDKGKQKTATATMAAKSAATASTKSAEDPKPGTKDKETTGARRLKGKGKEGVKEVRTQKIAQRPMTVPHTTSVNNTVKDEEKTKEKMKARTETSTRPAPAQTTAAVAKPSSSSSSARPASTSSKPTLNAKPLRPVPGHSRSTSITSTRAKVQVPSATKTTASASNPESSNDPSATKGGEAVVAPTIIDDLTKRARDEDAPHTLSHRKEEPRLDPETGKEKRARVPAPTFTYEDENVPVEGSSTSRPCSPGLVSGEDNHDVDSGDRAAEVSEEAEEATIQTVQMISRPPSPCRPSSKRKSNSVSDFTEGHEVDIEHDDDRSPSSADNGEALVADAAPLASQHADQYEEPPKKRGRTISGATSNSRSRVPSNAGTALARRSPRGLLRASRDAKVKATKSSTVTGSRRVVSHNNATITMGETGAGSSLVNPGSSSTGTTTRNRAASISVSKPTVASSAWAKTAVASQNAVNGSVGTSGSGGLTKPVPFTFRSSARAEVRSAHTGEDGENEKPESRTRTRTRSISSRSQVSNSHSRSTSSFQPDALNLNSKLMSSSGSNASTSGPISSLPLTTSSLGLSIPDFSSLHATQAAHLSQIKSSIKAQNQPTVPSTRPIGLYTSLRSEMRKDFDEKVKRKQEEMDKKREEERKEREEEEERELREMRKKMVVKAHEVPDWYRDAPKKRKRRGEGDEAGEGEGERQQSVQEREICDPGQEEGKQ
ncbi:hypothetical protein VKT23_009771 [Stygiomarasmius scandens]|uniref:TPX2 C-terminal domain-containing protein n=1 Tax=Marasmiellus scandens TaxID=2682957 RepID=A0ABR1JDX8_9AGAR